MKKMNTMMRGGDMVYSAPEAELVSVFAEAGFAASPDDVDYEKPGINFGDWDEEDI